MAGSDPAPSASEHAHARSHGRVARARTRLSRRLVAPSGPARPVRRPSVAASSSARSASGLHLELPPPGTPRPSRLQSAVVTLEHCRMFAHELEALRRGELAIEALW